jgi:sugar lactone lactonase YvrE
VVPRKTGGLMVALAGELVFFDPASGERTPFTAPERNKPDNRSNEARVDPTGRFWLGTMQNNIGPAREDLPITKASGALYRIEADGRYEKVVDAVGVSNTLCWDEKRARLYFADTMRGTIRVFDWEAASGRIANPRVFAPPHKRGLPDGSALDADGYLWNARWGGGCLIRYSPGGTVDRIIDVPVTNPTSCVFAGPELKTLYVTSAWQGMSQEKRAANPMEGALLVAEADVAGQPCTRLAA